jgi:hypothetical protein
MDVEAAVNIKAAASNLSLIHFPLIFWGENEAVRAVKTDAASGQSSPLQRRAAASGFPGNAGGGFSSDLRGVQERFV